MQNWEDEAKIIGITGNIGSGKSTVAAFIEKQGYLVLYSDKVAKSLMENDSQVKEKLTKEFGEDIYDTSGNLNKDYIRDLLFGGASNEDREKLNSIIHPRVFDANIESIESYYSTESDTKDMVFIESALAFESGMADGCDYVVQVSSDIESTNQRLTESREIDNDTIEKIRSTQLSQQEKERLADFVIHNTKTLDALEKSTNFILTLLKSMPPKFGREEKDDDSDD